MARGVQLFPRGNDSIMMMACSRVAVGDVFLVQKIFALAGGRLVFFF